MSEVVWVALISAGAALVTALATQYLATRAASKQTDRADKREALQWQRTEVSRQEALAREAKLAAQALALDEAQRLRALHEAQLKQLWGHVLAARWQMMDALERVPVEGQEPQTGSAVSASVLPANAAGQAYAAALLDLAAVRPAVRAFYVATSKLQAALQGVDQAAMLAASQAWSASYESLEQSVADLADSWRANGVVP